MDGFRMKVPLTTLTIEQISELLNMVEHRIAVMTNDEETLATFQD
jgi:hypothetical protein